uniref:tetratricopeptide repeat protein n=1 Tax=uncultured Brachyspira sp. TaxID=221953 RepID=UPI002613A50D
MKNNENTENNNQTSNKEKRNYQIYNYNVMIGLFILSIIVFAVLYFFHNFFICRTLDKAMERYSSPLENIIIAKEEFYTNVIITEIESNKFITNNIILKSSSIEDLQNAFSKAIDSHTKNLQISMSEIVKSSSDTLNFWLAFISVIMIVFSFAGAFVNNNILNEAKEKLNDVEKEAEKSLSQIKEETDKIIKENSKNVKINSELNLGYQAYQNKKYKEAIEYFSKVIELDDKNIYGYFNRALAKQDSKQYEEAIKDYDKAIELDNNNSLAYNNRGIAKAYLKLYEEAIKDFDEAI